MPSARRILTSFSKGELSPLLEGRPDLAAYFEGGSVVENFIILRQSGLRRRYGSRFINEVKFSNRDTILIPFEASVDDAYILEVGHQYMRFYKNKSRIDVAGTPIEVVSPYTEDQIRSIHFTQSVDVMFFWHPDVRQHQLSRISDTLWSLVPITYSPPPSFEADTDISLGGTLTPGATSGNGVTFTMGPTGNFIPSDVGRVLISGASRAIITAYTDATHVVADIAEDFISTSPIPTGQWFIRLSPQTTLDPDRKAPVGAQVILDTPPTMPAFRAADLGKYISIYGGLVKITQVVSATEVKGVILSEMKGTQDANPSAAPAGAWTLEVDSWSSVSGFPRTGEFFGGRLGQASTDAQPTTFWLSQSDDFNNYAVGADAAASVEHTIASRRLNRIEWLADNDDLFLGTSGAELRAIGGREGEPIGGDVIPLIKRMTSNGSAPIQPVVIGHRIIYVDRSRRKIFAIVYDLEQDGFDSVEITGSSEHITGTGVRLGPVGFTQRPDPRLFWVREDGQILALTYFPAEKVIGFSRIITDGTHESVAVKPHPSDSEGGHDEAWIIVKRNISGVDKRYVEMIENNASELATRPWKGLNTDCAIVYSGSAITTVTGLAHLEGKSVDVIANGGFRGQKVVTGGQIVLDEPAMEIEVGLHFQSVVKTMRPGIEGIMMEGLQRSWTDLWIRADDTLGGKINGEKIRYPGMPLNVPTLFTGDLRVAGQGWSTDERLTIIQDDPYPMTILAVFGGVEIGEHA